MTKDEISTRYAPLLIALTGVIIYLAYVVILITVTDNNLLGLISFGERFVDSETAGIASEFITPRTGYDGQFYYRLAQDPFSIQQTAFGITLDTPPLRQQRVLLPLLTSILALGDVARIPVVMMLINIIAVGACGWVAARIILRFNGSPWYGILFILYPGFAVSVGRFLTEPLASLLVLLSLLALLNRRNLLAAVMLSLAVLSRETATLFIAAGFFTWIAQLKWKPSDTGSPVFHPTPVFWVLPSLTFFFWQIWLYQQWGYTFLNSAQDSTFGIPGVGFVEAMVYNITYFDLANLFYLLMALLMLVYLVYIFPKAQKTPDLLNISFFAYLVLAICVGPEIWVSGQGFFRIFTELSLLGLLMHLVIKKRTGNIFAFGWMAVWLATAAAEWYRLAYWQQHYIPPSAI